MEKTTSHNVDDILIALGSKGKYQIFQFLTVYLVSFPIAFQLFSNVYTCFPVPFKCSPPPNISESLGVSLTGSDVLNYTYDSCSVTAFVNGEPVGTTECDYTSVEYDLPVEMSAVSQFGLVCGRANLARLTQTLVIAGQGIGAVLTTIVSDRLGRKIVLVSTNLALLPLGLVNAYAPNFAVFACTKFLIGAFQQGIVTSSVTYGMEMLPSDERRINAFSSGFTFSVGMVSFAFLSWLLRAESWRTLQTALSLSSVFFIFQWWYLDESLRWLIANGKTRETLKVLTRAARMNGKDLNAVLRVYHSGTRCGSLLQEEQNTNLKSVQLQENKTHQEDHREQLLHQEPLQLQDKKADPGEQKEQLPHQEPQQLLKNHANQEEEHEDLPEQNEVPPEASLVKKEFPDHGHTDTDTETLTGTADTKLTLLHLLKIPRVCVNCAIISFAWFTCAMGTFGLFLTSASLSSNKYIGFSMLSLCDVPSEIVAYSCMNKHRDIEHLSLNGKIEGKRAQDVSGSGPYGYLVLVSYLVGTFGGSGSFGMVFYYTPEMFPTNAEQAMWAPGILIASCAAVVVISLKALPETSGRELPQTLDDLKAWFHKPTQKDGKASAPI
ncbi:organic cation transporter-like protein [Aplysia californica]|uniref:Organic cation transporter-like protein n=1 Tax=Aplysia californica TaxID=6500 RepID=A0ABM0K5S8_APLCA|nr:organic cation transporter-like protein [Aplysia californica]